MVGIGWTSIGQGRARGIEQYVVVPDPGAFGLLHGVGEFDVGADVLTSHPARPSLQR